MNESDRLNLESLSPEGERRRAEIRDTACRAVEDRGRGARVVLIGGVGLVPLVVLAVVWFQFSAVGPGVTGDGGDGRLADGSNGGGETNEPYQMINGQFTIVRAEPREVPTVDDDELLALMERAGRPAGLVRVADEVRLVEHGRRGAGGILDHAGGA